MLLLISSCTYLPLRQRAGKDEIVSVAANSIDKLKGPYQFPATSNAGRHNALCYFKGCDSIRDSLAFFVVPAGHRQVHLQQPRSGTGDTLNLVLKGRYKKGYFITRRKWRAQFPAGPLLWTMDISRLALGMSKEGQLVLLYASGGALLIGAMPVSVSSDGHETFCKKTP